MGKADCHAFVVQQLIVVRLSDTIYDSKHQTLQRRKVILCKDVFDSIPPLSLEVFGILLVPLVARQLKEYFHSSQNV